MSNLPIGESTRFRLMAEIARSETRPGTIPQAPPSEKTQVTHPRTLPLRMGPIPNNIYHPPHPRAPAPHTPIRRTNMLISTDLSPQTERALQHALAPSTLAGYSSTVGRFIAFCHERNIPQGSIFPASEATLTDYSSSFAGERAGSTASSAIGALKAWHAINNAAWQGGPRLAYALKGVSNLAPSTSRRDPRPCVTRDMIRSLHEFLNIDDPFDAAVYAAAALAFWGQLRIGELLGTARSRHDPTRFPSRHSISPVPEVGISCKITLPFTKTTGNRGATVPIPNQLGRVDPIYAIAKHLHVNTGLPDAAHLFAFRKSFDAPVRCLTSEAFIVRCNEIWGLLGVPRMTGHSFRIGGTNAFLEAGIASDIVRVKGRWKSDAYFTYWRNQETLTAAHTEKITEPATRRIRIHDRSRGDTRPRQVFGRHPSHRVA